MKITVGQTQLGLRNSTTRIPFRYGKACLTKCPQAILAVAIDSEQGVATGYSGDCLPPSWFDKSPQRDYADQIDDMFAVFELAEQVFREEFNSPRTMFDGWLAAYERIQSRCSIVGMTPLLASFGTSLYERAMIDGICRVAGLSFAAAVRLNVLSIEAGKIHSELADFQPGDWLPEKPRESIFVRHTVGLSDPLTRSDVTPDERLSDGFPQTLEEYIEQGGLRYFKIKVCNQLDYDQERLRRIAKLIERRRGNDYQVTLDGNEQYQDAAAFDQLIDAIQSDEQLATLWKNVLAIEQPLERSVALSDEHTGGIRQLSLVKPVIIDESDGRLESYSQALALGYHGVSSKNCKGPIKSLLNAGLTWLLNDRGNSKRYLMTGEDLCTVGIVPVQSDLCLVATLGLEHVERNGHHYHPGLSYLPAAQQQAALRDHPDLYQRRRGRVAPRLVDGSFQIGSLQCVGFGFDVLPEMAEMQSPAEWQFDSL
jgi:hypothetical protein